jgi:hypothetical protein
MTTAKISSSELEKRFEVYLHCEDDVFQGTAYAGQVVKYLTHVTDQVAAGRFSSALYDLMTRPINTPCHYTRPEFERTTAAGRAVG